MRKTIAGWLIRAAHKINPPKVNVVNIHNPMSLADLDGRDLAWKLSEMQFQARF